MSLPSLRPANAKQADLAPAPALSAASLPYSRREDNRSTPRSTSRPPTVIFKPVQNYDAVLTAQEAEEDCRLQARSDQRWRDSQEYSCPEDNETTPWLKHTKWPEVFRNRPLDIITSSMRQPVHRSWNATEDYVLGTWQGMPLRSTAAAEARLRVLMRAVDDIFDRAESTLARTSYCSRCWLSSYHKEKFWNHPLHVMQPATMRSYRSKWKRFICYVFRALGQKPRQRRDIYNIPLRADDVTMMNHVLDLASHFNLEPKHGISESDASDCESSNSDENYDESEESDNMSDADEESEARSPHDGPGKEVDHEEEGGHKGNSSTISNFRLPNGLRLELSEALFQLSMMFWTYQSQDGVMASSTIIHFTAVLGIHGASLAYREAQNSTSNLAALIWIGRLFFLEYSLPQYGYDTLVCKWPARSTYPSHPKRLEAIRTKYMLRGCHSPLSELIELKAFGKSITRKEGPRGNLTWAPDGQSFAIGDDKVIQLSEFCATFERAITCARERVAEMMLGWEPALDLSEISDDMTCRQSSWCFLDKPENKLTGLYKAMARRAWSSSFRGQAFTKAGHWLPGTCQTYMEASTELAAHAYAACHITWGLPRRGSETTSIRLQNTKLSIRNLFIRGGQVIVVFSYNKSRASNNYAFYVVRYLRDDLGFALFLYIAYIQPFVDFLANQLQQRQYHSNEFLFPDPKHKQKHLSPAQATVTLRNLTQNLQTPWTISIYRQAAIAIANRHIRELIEKRKFYCPSDASSPIRMIAAGSGHHPRMLLTAYAIDKALPARLQPELLEMYRRLSTLWQNWNQKYYEDDCFQRQKILADPEAEPLELDPSKHIRWGKRSLSSSGITITPKRRKGIDLPPASDFVAIALPQGFMYNAEYQIVICVACESIVQPGGLYRHLNGIHRLTGPVCRSYIEQLSKLRLKSFEELVIPQEIVVAIPGLRIFEVFRCNICRHFTRWRATSLQHISSHKLGISPKRH